MPKPQQQQQQQLSAPMTRKKEERAPQWGSQETDDFISICAQLEHGVTQPNKTSWKTIASHMQQKGHHRTAAQCKCKWTSLLNSYKGKGSLDSVSSQLQQCPHFEGLHAILTSQPKKPDKTSSASKARSKKKKRALATLDQSSDEFSDEDDDDDDDESESDHMAVSKKRKLDRERKRATAEKCRANNMRMVLDHFLQQQERLEMQWREALERKEEECRKREQEFRHVMASLESESFAREQQWRHRDDQRRAREEARADQRDHLLSAILDQLVKKNNYDMNV